MSQENVEVVRTMMDAWNRGDYAAAIESFAPDVRTECVLGGDFDGTFEGIDGMQRWLARFWASFADFHTEADECIDAGDHVVIAAHHHGRGKTSGIEVEMLNWQVFTFRDGKVIRYRLFRAKPEALEAAGLSE